MGFDLQKQRLWVVTDPIELEGVFLGRFEVRLHWSQLGDFPPYRVKAIDPHPASSDSCVTHPHVNDRRLCEGDGKAAIRTALKEGRLFDFFVVVRQVLESYNESSAYVSLESWSGRTCIDCRGISEPSETRCCEWCESDVCSDCMVNCSDCGRTCCSQCRIPCQRCEDVFCESCLSPCNVCLDSCCAECVNESICDPCRETLEVSNENLESPPEKEASPPPTGAEVHAGGVLEARSPM